MLPDRELVGSPCGRVAGAARRPAIEDIPVKMRIAVLGLLVSAGSVFAQSAPAAKEQPATGPGNAVPATPASPAKKIEQPVKIQPVEKKDENKAEPTLKVGSDAPKLEYTKWVKGTEVKTLEKGKVYVVEFWATWCPPCRDSIPHLTELAKKYPSVTIIGMASSERKGKDDKEDKRLANLEKFVKDQGDTMNYAVAFDADRKMSTSWMRPAGQNGIPCAFIVNAENKIAWIGNPLNQSFESEIAKLAPAVKDGEKKDAEKKDAKPATTLPATPATPAEKKDKK
jgi:thiol-disulfide isomerase/thioredoxin